MIDKLSSIHGIDYSITKKNFLGLEFYSLSSLDLAIDDLCNKLGEAMMDDALKEDYCPYFGVPWEAGLGLSQYLEKLDLEGTRIIEIGSGLSLPSFIATRKKAHVIASDFHGDVKAFLDLNQKTNNIYFEFFQMNWRKDYRDLGKFDYVIGSDILYESAHPDHVAISLKSFLRPGGKIILSDPGRAYVQKFITSMNNLGFTEKLSIEKVSTEWTQKEVFVFEFV
jgi:predicted nicotinamide N-methyase